MNHWFWLQSVNCHWWWKLIFLTPFLQIKCLPSWLFYSKPSLKIRTASAICWNYLGLFRDYGLDHIFFRNETFLFFKIDNWNFLHLFEKEFRETSQNFNSFSLFRQFFFSNFSIGCLIEMKFCQVSQKSFSNRFDSAIENQVFPIYQLSTQNTPSPCANCVLIRAMLVLD